MEVDWNDKTEELVLHVRFSLRFVLLVLTTLALAFAFLAELRRREVALQSARAAVQHGLLQRHWEWWAGEDSPYIRQLGGELRGSGSWSFELIDATDGTLLLDVSKPAVSLDDFEKKAIKQIRAGAKEAGRVSWDGKVRFVQAVDLSKRCMQCHAIKMKAAVAIVSVRGPAK